MNVPVENTNVKCEQAVNTNAKEEFPSNEQKQSSFFTVTSNIAGRLTGRLSGGQSYARSHSYSRSPSLSRWESKSSVASRMHEDLGEFQKMSTDAIVAEFGSRGQELAPRSLEIDNCDLVFHLHEDVLVKDFLSGASKWASPERWTNGMMKKESYLLVMAIPTGGDCDRTIEKLLKCQKQLGAGRCSNSDMILVCTADTPEDIDLMNEKSKIHPAIHFLAIDVDKLCLQGSKFEWAVVKTVAGASVAGVAAGGVAGGAVGGVAGTALGAAVGIVPAIFTFGLSVPVCAIVGGGLGVCTGAATGSAVGAVGGGGAGYLGYRNRDKMKPIVNKFYNP